MVSRRELGRNAVGEKSVAEGIGVGYQEDPRWAKKINPTGSGGILKNHSSCTLNYDSNVSQFQMIIYMYL